MASIIGRLDGATGQLTASAIALVDGETLYSQGEQRPNVYFIESGYLLLTQVNATGGSTISLVLRRDELLGPGLLNDDAIATHTATARGPARLRQYREAQFRNLLARDPLLAQLVINMLVRRQRFTETRLQAVLTLDVTGRLAVVLHDLVRHYGGRCEHGHEVDIPLTQQQLADMIGASRAAVSTRLNQLRRAKLLDYTREFICINDLEAFRCLAAGLSMSSS